ncbi:Exodeoxyribonuclease VII small subunit [Caloramator quimbayensis]|uniref:Exodeoxyribonuclease 7 small subunit n=1 Tax=Caloramator quimbayensis TaxID=1147123 RepID=A0A1T4WXX5_9CLOT|nr:exodeoxyribonuclease VII small subunit [Caloramator quimbayensis]SKA82007.1 Exodeoxyribonuclease VII small subunit [Caloramator quimbayensis]
MEQGRENIKFEDALKRLEEIADYMESDNLSLEESLKMFEEGMRLADFCNKKLDSAQKKISIILKDKDSNIVEEDFTLEEE